MPPLVDVRNMIDPKSPEIVFGNLVNEYIDIAAQADHENHIPYMYLDSGGHLTVGVGHLMIYHPGPRHPHWTKETVRAAVTKIFPYGFRSKFAEFNSRIGLIMRGTGISTGPVGGLHQLQLYHQYDTNLAPTPADNLTPGVWGQNGPAKHEFTFNQPALPTVDIITEDAINILNQSYKYTQKDKKGKVRNHTYGAPHYEQYNRFEMTNDGIDSLAFDDTLDKIQEIRAQKAFKQFADFPHAAQLGVLDLAYQYGAPGLASHTAFAQAVTAQDWKKAAANVPSGVANNTRTAWRRGKFNEAATPPPLK